jgi:uncharacterized protein YyaL (SSP411 family)
MRTKEDYDGAEPSGNSVALMNLLRLHRITGRKDFDASARRLLTAFADRISSTPYAMPQMLSAIEYSHAAAREIVVSGEIPAGMHQALWKHFDPNRILLRAAPELAAFHPGMEDMRGPAVYVCQNFGCQAPVNTEEDLLRLLE